MKQVRLSDLSKISTRIPFFYFESAKLRHYFIREEQGGYLIDSGHTNGIYLVQDSDIYISDANYIKHFKKAAD